MWSIGGGFKSPDPWSFNKYVGLVWWDPDAIDPEQGNKGANRFLNGGRRYTDGEIPIEPLPWFESGITVGPSD